MVFSIRDIYLDSATDFGMNYHGALAEREGKSLKKVAQIPFTKYKGLNEMDHGEHYKEEEANILVYQTLAKRVS